MSTSRIPQFVLAALTGAPAAADYIPTTGTSEIRTLEAEGLMREFEDGHGGAAFTQTSTKRGFGLTMQTYLCGSGTAGTASRFGRLLRACAMVETVATTPDPPAVIYTMADIGAPTESVNLSPWKHGELQAIQNARGTFTATFAAGQLPTFEFVFSAPYVAATNGARPAISAGGVAAPVPVDAETTPTFSLGGTGLVFSNLTYTHGAEVVLHDNGGSGGKLVTITNYMPSITATVIKPTGGYATFNPYAKHTSGAVDQLLLVHGPAGNRCTLAANVSYGIPTEANVNDLAAWEIPLTPHRPTLGSLTGWLSFKFD